MVIHVLCLWSRARMCVCVCACPTQTNRRRCANSSHSVAHLGRCVESEPPPWHSQNRRHTCNGTLHLLLVGKRRTKKLVVPGTTKKKLDKSLSGRSDVHAYIHGDVNQEFLRSHAYNARSCTNTCILCATLFPPRHKCLAYTQMPIGERLHASIPAVAQGKK